MAVFSSTVYTLLNDLWYIMVYCEWFREEGIISTMKDVLKERQKSGVSVSGLPNSTVIYFEVRMSKTNGYVHFIDTLTITAQDEYWHCLEIIENWTPFV